MNKGPEFIYETEFWYAKLSPDQTYLGRCVIVLKRECGEFSNLNREEMIDFLDNVVKRLEGACKKAFGATMFNWACLMNNAYQEESPKPQVHWHFRPRYAESVSISNEVFTDPNFGHHYNRDLNRPVSDDMRDSIIKMMQEYIS